MTGMMLETLAQSVVGRVVNTLPEGLLLASAAWMLLRLLGKQNAGTRFAVWLVALVGVAGLPFLSGLDMGGAGRLASVGHAEVTIPAHWAIAILAIWIPLALAALARVAAGVWQVRAISNSCSEVDLAALEPAMRSAVEQAGLGAESGRRARLLTSETARVPAAIGFRRPAIVLPGWCLREMSAGELEPILIHEMEHLRRRDDWTNLLQKVVRAVLFFHPAVWWIDARLAAEREMACDDAVLAQTQDARSYAGSLIGLLERSCARRGWTMAQAAVARARDASMRIARILSGGAAATTCVGRGAVGWIAGLSLACCGLLGIAPQLVRFAPDSPMRPAQAASGDAVVSAGQRDFAPRMAAAVPAMYHPEHAHVSRANAALRTRMDESAVPAVGSVKKQHSARPAMMMAKLDMTGTRADGTGADRARAEQPASAAPAMQMVMIVETAQMYPPAQDAVAVNTKDAVAVNTTGGGNPKPVPATATGVVQVRTVQVMEQDETGWHLHTYRLVRVVPLDELLELESSI